MPSNRIDPRRLPLSTWLVFPFTLLIWAIAPSPLRAEPVTDAATEPAILPEKILTRDPRSEIEEDRVTAIANFLQGRTAQQRGDQRLALRKFERSWRYDSGNSALVAEIISLATQQDLPDEARRYALQAAAQVELTDPIFVRRLALILAKNDEYESAAKMFERALELAKDQGEPPSDLSQAYLLLELGRLHVKAGNPLRGAQLLSRLRQSLIEPHKTGFGPENVAVILDQADHTWALMGETFLLAKHWEDAADAFRRANDAKPEPARLQFNLARIASGKNDLAAALSALDATFAEDFSDLRKEPLQLLEDVLRRQETSAELAASKLSDRLRKLHDQDPKNQDVSLFLARNLLNDTAEFEAVRTMLQNVLKTYPSAEAYENLGLLYLQQKKMPELAQLLEEVVAKTGSLAAVENLRNKLLAKEQNPLRTELIRITNERQEKETDSQAAAAQSFAVGLLALQSDDVAGGETLLKQAAEHFPRPIQVYLQWSQALLSADQPAKAAEVLQKALDVSESESREGTIRYYLAGALELAGRTEAALAALDGGGSQAQDNPLFLHRRAWVLSHAKRWSAAEQAYQDLVARLDGGNQGSTRDLILESKLVLSHLCTRRADRTAAIEWLEQVLDEDPTHSGALNDLSYLWSERGEHLQRSLTMAQSAIVQQPDNLAFRDTLGWIYFQLGQFPLALKEIESAVREDSSGEVLEHWGDVLEKLGRRDEALSAWQRAATAYETEELPDRQTQVRDKIMRVEKTN